RLQELEVDHRVDGSEKRYERAHRAAQRLVRRSAGIRQFDPAEPAKCIPCNLCSFPEFHLAYRSPVLLRTRWTPNAPLFVSDPRQKQPETTLWSNLSLGTDRFDRQHESLSIVKESGHVKFTAVIVASSHPDALFRTRRIPSFARSFPPQRIHSYRFFFRHISPRVTCLRHHA